mmetsp:Transcript_7610/g.23746  ORF Transcript_7610/g.23746 Transcript_7610/m.23746 type:complete len:134 (+) Transcript_7610:119-520(+)|eukprot:scaffold141375_cov30-Tisochrysis_lutea.AAC.1
MSELTEKEAFQLVEALVQGWRLSYVHHIRVIAHESAPGFTFSVIFSKPTDTVPIPPQVATITIMLKTASDAKEPLITYVLESETMQRPRNEVLQEHWLDKIIDRKIIVEQRAKTFQENGKLPIPQAYKVLASR